MPFRDISSGFRLYRRRVLLDIQPLEPHGLDILPEILVKALCQGWRVAEVPFWYRGSRPWDRTRMARFGTAYLATLGRMLSLRNSVRAADYDNRAFDSWVPLQRAWQRRRFEIVHEMMGPRSGGRSLDVGCGSSRIVQTLPGWSGWIWGSTSCAGSGRRDATSCRGRSPICPSPSTRSTASSAPRSSSTSRAMPSVSTRWSA